MSESRYLLTRRRFMPALAGAFAPLSLFAAEDDAQGGPWAGPATVRKVYIGGARAGWPRPDVDQEQDVKAIEAQLAEVERRYPGQIRFTGGELIRNADQLSAWLAKPDDSDVVLVFPMITIVYPLIRKVVDTGKPVVQFSLPYAGHDWSHAAAMMQKGTRLELIASSDFHDLDPYVSLFRTIHHLRHSKVLLIAPPAARPKGEPYTQQFGAAFGYPAYAELKAVYDSVDVEQARKLAREFIESAAKIVEPPENEIVDSLRQYLAMKQLLTQEKANAISIDCLGGFGRGELPAYPCVGFSKLNDAGLYGVCECDLESTMTQLLVTSFSNKPGFVSDPVFDTSRNEVIHAHCVSATQLKGIGTAPSPFMVRTHLEDHKGVSMQGLAPAGEAVTVARFVDAKKLMVSTGEAVGNVDDERGCRTKIRTRVKDARKLLTEWSGALNTGPSMPGTRDLLHRVVFYGDHVESIERLSRLTGFQVAHEG